MLIQTRRSSEKLVYGVGVNDAKYITQIREGVGYEGDKRKRKVVWICPVYARWINMLARCYSVKNKENSPTYVGCSMHKDWFRFSNFLSWCEAQPNKNEELFIDKDIIHIGNKVYSPNSCALVCRLTNNFVTASNKSRGEHPVGVSYHKLTDKFSATIRDPFKNKSVHLGLFANPNDAHESWRVAKDSYAQGVADIQQDIRVEKALRVRYKPDSAVFNLL